MEEFKGEEGAAIDEKCFLSSHPQERGTSELGIYSTKTVNLRDSLLLPSSVYGMTADKQPIKKRAI